MIWQKKAKEVVLEEYTQSLDLITIEKLQKQARNSLMRTTQRIEQRELVWFASYTRKGEFSIPPPLIPNLQISKIQAIYIPLYFFPFSFLPSSIRMDTCKLLAGYLDTLAEKYPSTKFVSIVGDKVSFFLFSFWALECKSKCCIDF